MDFSSLIVQRVLSAHVLFNESGAASYRENRASTALLLRFEGETVYHFGEECLLSNLTHPVLLPKGSSYHWQCLQAGHWLIVEFDTDLTAETPIGFSLSDPTRLQALLQRLKLLCLQHPLHWELSARAAVYEALHLLYTASAQTPPYVSGKKATLLRPALDYIHLHYGMPISNEGLAALTGVSTVYFRKLFRAVTGTSPIRYLHRVRIDKAKELLKSDYATLSEVASSVGYADVFHFSKTFKSITGISPGAYAKQK